MSDIFGIKLGKVPYTIPYWQSIFRQLRLEPWRWFRRLNTIVDFFEWSCDVPFVLYVELMLPALGEAVLTLLEFDWDDVLRGALRPYGPAGRKSLVFDPLKRKWQFELPELGEEIGKRIPGARFIKANKFWAKTRFLWIIDSAIQRVFYYWLIADVLGDFLYNWTSGILRHPRCQEGGVLCRGGVFGDSGAEGVHLLPHSNVLNPCQIPSSPDGAVFLDREGIRFRRPGALLASYTLIPVFPVECRARWHMFAEDEAGNVLDVSPPALSWLGGWQDAMFVVRVPYPTKVVLKAVIEWSTCNTILWGRNVVAAK